MTVAADLHVHTVNSDGTLTVAALPAAARRAGVDAVAVTDHDRAHPALDAPVTAVDGVTLIHGIELRVADRETGARLDLLGYGLAPTDALLAELDRLQRDRIDRGAAIIECVEDRLGVALDLEPRAGIGRPHIARAVAAHPAVEYDVQAVFDRLIGDDGPCYVPRSVPSFERGRRLLAASCAVVGLAHPLRYDDPAAALRRARHLDAVERWYPYDRPIDTAPVDRAIEAYDLLATGGSDAHDTVLGRAGPPTAAYRRLRARLPES